jgi:LuxR family maltose regulon positive regulatory protein
MTVETADFGTLLRRHRLAAGWTQEELAQRANLSPRAIGSLERGDRHAPYRRTLQQLATALELTGEERSAFDAAGRHVPTNATAQDLSQGVETGADTVPDFQVPHFSRRELDVEDLSELLPASSPTGGSGSTIVLLRTKLSIPPPRPDRVERSRLVERLTAALDRRLTLVSAPAGFGKTTLLAEWVGSCGRPVAWLSLDPGDNDPVRFLTYLVAAVQTIDGDLSHNAATHPVQGDMLGEQLTVLLNQVSQMGPFILVLDDYHRISAEVVHGALAFLLEHVPSGVHLAIATRADPPLPLARLRVRSQLCEVRARDLQFTVEEAHAFLNSTMGLQVDAGVSTMLQVRTEGWVAGLQLAGLSLQGREDAEEFIAAFAGTHRHILDYLIEEVLSRQPQEIQNFLLRTSILSRLTGPLCHTVAGTPGTPDGQAVLETLEAANLFTIPLDDERCWYRYHHLFADCLQAQLRRTAPELLPKLHHRAAEWYAANSRTVEAVDHALQSGHPDEAARLIEEVALELLAQSRHATVRHWLEALPKDVLERQPSLCVFYGWILLEAFDAAATQWLDVPEDTDLPSHLRFLRTALRARLSWLHGEPGQIKPFASEALTDQGPFPEADVPDPRVRAYLTLYACAQIGEALRLQGQLRQAVQIYRDVLQRVDHIERDARVLSALSFAEMGLGRLLYEQNDLRSAEHHLTGGIELARRGHNEQYESWGYMFLPPVRQAQNRGAEALDLVDRAERSARQRGLPAEVLWCTSQRTRLACIQGDLDDIATWVSSYRSSVEQEAANGKPLGYIEEFASATYIRALLALGRGDEAAQLSEHLLRRAEAGAQTGHTIEFLIMAAQAREASGNRSLALSYLERALTLAEPEGYVRIFVDEGEPIAALLIAGRRHFSAVSPAYVQELLDVLGNGSVQARKGEAQPLVEPLTAREIDVLRLLTIGLPNREIADRLVVSLGTVKRHTGNIYGKLGVDNRTQAILRAQELGLF